MCIYVPRAVNGPDERGCREGTGRPRKTPGNPGRPRKTPGKGVFQKRSSEVFHKQVIINSIPGLEDSEDP